MEANIELHPVRSARDQNTLILIAVLILAGTLVLFLFIGTWIGQLLWCSFEAAGIGCFVLLWRRGWKDYPHWLRPRSTLGWALLYAAMSIYVLRDFASLAHDPALGKFYGLLH
jgi:hypothetical protein